MCLRQCRSKEVVSRMVCRNPKGARTGTRRAADGSSLRRDKHWEGHATLQRIWVMLSAIWQLLQNNKPDEALARTVQCLKATGRATRQGGSWSGAWELTNFPEIGGTRMDVTITEEASLSRHLREKAACLCSPPTAATVPDLHTWKILQDLFYLGDA